MLKILTITFIVLNFANNAFSIHVNHNKPFGTGPVVPVDHTNGFVDPIQFLESFVNKNKPLLMKQAAKNFPAFKKWNDEYFLDLNLSHHQNTINCEKRKKEDRTLRTMEMGFKDFIRMYNDSDIYMVDSLPTFLNEDILYPWSLQCNFLDENIFQVLMWFSSGNTSSVVHTDDKENINCLIRGEKTFVLVDPDKHRDKIPLKKEGAYSDIDVDRVDFLKYKLMEDVDFIIAKMVAGDCIYLPKLWIHQVRSFQRNIAINIWFRVPENYLENFNKTDLMKKCNEYPNDNKTFSRTHYLGLNSDIYQKTDGIKMISGFQNKSISEAFATIVKVYNDVDQKILNRFSDHITSVIKDIIDEIDKNGDSIINEDEIEQVKSESLGRIANYINYLKTFLESLSIEEQIKNSVDAIDRKELNNHNEL